MMPSVETPSAVAVSLPDREPASVRGLRRSHGTVLFRPSP